MSWNFTVVGKDKALAKAKVQACDRAPKYLLDAICAAVDTLPDGRPFVIDSTGHLDANGGNAKFNIRTTQVYGEF